MELINVTVSRCFRSFRHSLFLKVIDLPSNSAIEKGLIFLSLRAFYSCTREVYISWLCLLCDGSLQKNLLLPDSSSSCHGGDSRTYYFPAAVLLSYCRQDDCLFFSQCLPFKVETEKYIIFQPLSVFYIQLRQENFIFQSLSSCRHSDRKKS